jgi:hypothetical protein
LEPCSFTTRRCSFKYALSQLPKKRKKSFLSDWLEIKESGKKDKSITKIQSIIYNLLFDIFDSKYCL